MSRIVVIGAGPAGLISALCAAEKGHEVTLLDAAVSVGGMAGSFEIAGQRVDFGSHRLHPATDPVLMARISGLLGDDLQTRRRNGRIRLKDRWVGFPLTPAGMATGLPMSFTARVARDTAIKLARRAGDHTDSFLGALQHRLGPTVANDFYAPYARKLYGTEPSLLTSELADRRVAATSPLTILRNSLRATRADGRVFFYPRRGYGQISETLAEAAIEAGVDLRLASPVKTVETEQQLTVNAADTTYETDLILSSMPIERLAAGLAPPAPSHIRTALSSTRHRAMVLVYLVVPRRQYTSFDAHYLPDDRLRVSRLSEPKNYRDGDDPADQTVLCAEVPCWVGDDIWTASPDDLATQVDDELQRSGLPPTDWFLADVRRLSHVYPVYDIEGEADRATINAWQIDPRIITFGRQGLGVPDNLHHVLAMGVAAANAVTDSTVDRKRWASSLDAFADHVVQD